MLNRIVLMGRLVRDPELRKTQGGTSTLNITLACERDFKGQNGSRETDFIDCVAYRQTAEFINTYFAKGNLMAVEGRLQVREYTDRNNNQRRVSEVLVDHVYFTVNTREETADKADTAEQLTEEDYDQESLPF